MYFIFVSIIFLSFNSKATNGAHTQTFTAVLNRYIFFYFIYLFSLFVNNIDLLLLQRNHEKISFNIHYFSWPKKAFILTFCFILVIFFWLLLVRFNIDGIWRQKSGKTSCCSLSTEIDSFLKKYNKKQQQQQTTKTLIYTFTRRLAIQ